MELELNSLDWNVNELKHEHKLEDMKQPAMKHTIMSFISAFK